MSAAAGVKARLHRIVHVGDTRAGKAFDVVVLALILSSVVAFVAESYEAVAREYARFFAAFETFVVIAFTVEYLLRFWTCDHIPDGAGQAEPKRWLRAKAAFALRPMSLIDLLAILPFYVRVGDLRVVRVLRVFRVFRVLKLARYSDALQTMGAVLKDQSHALVVFIFIVFTTVFLASSGMYYAEHDRQPQAFPSIPHTFWWAIVTLTTVGYGTRFR